MASMSSKAIGSILLLMFVLGTTAHAFDQTVAIRTLKLKDSGTKQRLSLSVTDKTLAFPPATGAMSPASAGAVLEIVSAENPTGASFAAPGNAAASDPGWTYLGNRTARHKFKHRGAPDAVSTIKKIKIKESGRLKLIGLSTSGAMLSAATDVFIRLTIGDLRICGRIESQAIVEVVSGEKWFARGAFGYAPLVDCTTPVFQICGAGDMCENASHCNGAVCTGSCVCGDCPVAMTWGLNADGEGSQQTLGWSGILNGVQRVGGGQTTLALDCSTGVPADCGTCTVLGVDQSSSSCRCAGDSQTTCDEPLQPDLDDCAGAMCECFTGPPDPSFVGGTPRCVSHRLASNVSGTVNTQTGQMVLDYSKSVAIFLGICPTCVGDLFANDGVRGGLCLGGQSDGLACDANGSHSQLPAPGGASYSLDCMPSSSRNISGAGLPTDLHPLSTDVASLTASIPCTAPGFELFDCHCPDDFGSSSRPNRCAFACNAGPEFGVGCGVNGAAINGTPTTCSAGPNIGRACDEDVDCPDGLCNINPTHCTLGDPADEGRACATNGDCGGGTCVDACPGGRCVPLCDPTPGDAEQGRCAAGPPTYHCSGVGFEGRACSSSQAEGNCTATCSVMGNPCTSDEDCEISESCEGSCKLAGPCEAGVDEILGTGDDNPGAGVCIADERRCSLDPLVATGSPGLIAPTMTAVGCVGASSGTALNNSWGLGGPARTKLEMSVRYE